MIDLAVIRCAMSYGATVAEAVSWYHSNRIPGFNDMTPADLVDEGRGYLACEALDRAAAGGYV